MCSLVSTYYRHSKYSVALLELGRAADRQTRLSHIEKHWDQNFESSDLEILPAAAQPRWKKVCEWDLHFMYKEGLARRPKRGLWELTQIGIQTAQALRKELP